MLAPVLGWELGKLVNRGLAAAWKLAFRPKGQHRR
jgi:hypothetical protein